MNTVIVFCREGARIRALLPKGASLRNFPCWYTLSRLRRLSQKGTLTRGPHDRTRPRSGTTHFAGAPPKLCIYDNSTYQPTNQLTYQTTNLPNYQPTNIPTYQITNLSTNLPTYQPTDLPTNIPTNLPTCQPTELQTINKQSTTS